MYKRKLFLLTLFIVSSLFVNATTFFRLIVKKGETISCISKQFGIRETVLRKANPSITEIKEGDVLRLPLETDKDGKIETNYKLPKQPSGSNNNVNREKSEKLLKEGVRYIIEGNSEKAIKTLEESLTYEFDFLANYQLGHYYCFGVFDIPFCYKDLNSKFYLEPTEVNRKGLRPINIQKGLTYFNNCLFEYLIPIYLDENAWLFNPQFTVFHIAKYEHYITSHFLKKIIYSYPDYSYNIKEWYIDWFSKEIDFTKKESAKMGPAAWVDFAGDFTIFTNDSVMKLLNIIEEDHPAYYINEKTKSDNELIGIALSYYNNKHYPEAFYYLERLATNGDKYADELRCVLMHNLLNEYLTCTDGRKALYIAQIMSGYVEKYSSDISELSEERKKLSREYHKFENEWIKRERAERIKEAERKRMQAERENRKNSIWGNAILNVFGNILQSAATFYQTSTFNPYQSNMNNSFNSFINMPHFSSDAQFTNYVKNQLDAIAVQSVQQCQQEDMMEYLSYSQAYKQMTGKDISHEEYWALKGQAIQELNSQSGNTTTPSFGTNSHSQSSSSYSTSHKCRVCAGDGKCTACRGKGWLVDNQFGTGEHPDKECGVCKGKKICWNCNGSGNSTKSLY